MVKGVWLDAQVLQSGPQKRVIVTSRAPRSWQTPYELTLLAFENSNQIALRSEIGRGILQAFAESRPIFRWQEESQVFGRITPFIAAEDKLVLRGVTVERLASQQYGLYLRKPVTVTSASGYRVTFPPQRYKPQRRYSGRWFTTLRLNCIMSVHGRTPAFGARIPRRCADEMTTASFVFQDGDSLLATQPLAPGGQEAQFQMVLRYSPRRTDPAGVLTLKIQHRANLDSIPFATIASP